MRGKKRKTRDANTPGHKPGASRPTPIKFTSSSSFEKTPTNFIADCDII